MNAHDTSTGRFGYGIYVAVGTPDDPTYNGCSPNPLHLHCGDWPDPGIQSQVFVTCKKLGKTASDVDDKCDPISTPNNVISPCNADTQIGGVSNHDTVKVCERIIDRIASDFTPGCTANLCG